MKRHDHGARVLASSVAAVALMAMTAIGVTAQSGKPVPRLSNGKPDFTGVWDHPRVGDITSPVKGACASGGQGCSSVVSGELAFTPAGKAKWDKNNKPTTYDYGAHCQPWGFCARTTHVPHAYVHHPNSLAILWEQDNRFHLVPTDGRELPKDPEPTWMGTSVGRWDGDTLVVQTAGFNGRTWLDTAQHPHSEALKLTIRMARPTYHRMTWDITIEDPKSPKPIKNSRTFVLIEKGGLFDYSAPRTTAARVASARRPTSRRARESSDPPGSGCGPDLDLIAVRVTEKHIGLAG